MKKTLVLIVISLSLVWVCVFSLQQRERQNAIDTSLNWARMAPLPESTDNLDILVEGSMFTREFETSFQASEEDIKAWLRDSSGTAFSPRDASTMGTITYKVSEPNAVFAQVSVNWETLTVVIHTYWS